MTLVFTNFTSAQKNNQSKTDAKVYRLLQKVKDDKRSSGFESLSDAYQTASRQHLSNISRLTANNNEPGDLSVIEEYQALQNLYDSIRASACCSGMSGLQNYREKLDILKLTAAEFYYEKGNKLSDDSVAESIRQAYTAFETAARIIPGYQDAEARMNELYSSNLSIVAFGPVEDSLFFTQRGFSKKLYSYINSQFVDQVMNDLSKQKTEVPFLKLMTLSQCSRENILPTWVIRISIPEMSTNGDTITRIDNGLQHTVTTTEVFSSSPRIFADTGMSYEKYRNNAFYHDRNYNLVSSARLDLKVDIVNPAENNILFSRHFMASYVATSATYSLYSSSGGTVQETKPREKVMKSLFLQVLKQYRSTIATIIGN